jgi:hypothetical protein
MSWEIQICRAKPNPAGKDRAGNNPLQEQLLGEWVDLQNVGNTSVNLSVITLFHLQYSQTGIAENHFTPYWRGNPGEVLNPGEILRVHTGKSAYATYMRDVDKQGVHRHSFAESGNFVLNNRFGDTISIWWRNSQNEWVKEDQVSYDPNPPDGAILRRSGDKLVPIFVSQNR